MPAYKEKVLKQSEDGGRTWSKAKRLVTSPFVNLSTLVEGRPLALMDGSSLGTIPVGISRRLAAGGTHCRAAVAAAMRSTIVLLWIAASAAAWQSSLFASTNLWDYVIDPVVWIASLVLLAVAAVRRAANMGRAPEHGIHEQRERTT